MQFIRWLRRNEKRGDNWLKTLGNISRETNNVNMNFYTVGLKSSNKSKINKF